SVIVYTIFFFQAEDGIRDRNVTGVQTCALPISIEVQHAGAVGVPGRYNWGSPPVTTLVVVNVPVHGWVVWVAGVVVLGVDLYAVSVWIAQVEVVSVGYAVTAWAALEGIRLAACTELVADTYDVVLFVRSESDVLHTCTVATGDCGVMHGWLAAHPRSVDGSFGIPDVFGNAEAMVYHVVDGLWHIRSDL